jgi:hypothetical protein
MLHKQTCIDTLQSAGISYHDAIALRRISMTLHRWHELECGDENQYSSWCISRGAIKDGDFHYDDDGAPHLETHSNTSNTRTRYVRIADRERGALKRLAAIVANYPGFGYYVQGDPRGCALYILRPGDIPDGSTADSCCTRGIGVYR